MRGASSRTLERLGAQWWTLTIFCVIHALGNSRRSCASISRALSRVGWIPEYREPVYLLSCLDVPNRFLGGSIRLESTTLYLEPQGGEERTTPREGWSKPPLLQ